ncbi:MAG: hypothetical protein BME94_00315 [Methanobacteriales archaeon Met13]
MNIETEINEMKEQIREISKKLDLILEEKEINSLMELSEKSLNDFFEDEPDIYQMNDLKVRYQ